MHSGVVPLIFLFGEIAMIKRVLFALVLCLSFVNLFAQEGHKLIGKSRYVATYKLVCQTDTIEGATKDDRFMLQISDNEMSRWVSEYSYRMDSICALPNGKKIWCREIESAFAKNGRPDGKRSKEYIYQNYPERGDVTVTDAVAMQWYDYNDDLHPQVWEVQDSLRIIDGYECYLATTDFRGRHWYAWFTTEIPIDNGPWKLGGLPGLILEAYDQNNHYHYSLLGFEQKEMHIYYALPIDLFDKTVGTIEKTDRIKLLRAKATEDLKISMQLESMGIRVNESESKPYDLQERDYR